MLKKNKMYSRKQIGIISCLFVVGLIMLIVGISAKYTTIHSKNDDTVSNDFYFTSPMLSETGISYTLMPQTTELDIPVCNYADSLRYSQKDIEYSYTVTKDENGDSSKEISTGNGTISTGKTNTDNIVLNDLKVGTYKVTAKTTSPFITEIKGTFTIPEESEGVGYTVTDKTGSPYVLVTVWTKNYDGKVKITWPEGVIPDSTNSELQSMDTYKGNESDTNLYVSGSVTISTATYSSVVYRFFKEDSSKIYSNTNFTAAKVNS